MKKRLTSIALAIALTLTLLPTLGVQAAADAPVSTLVSGLSGKVIKADGTLWAWGGSGEDKGEDTYLGNGSRDGSLVPIKIMDNAAYVTEGMAVTYVIKTDNSLWVWGYHPANMLGNGEMESLSPTKIMDGVASVTTSGDNTFVIKTDGSLWGWGRNNGYGGLLGDGTTQMRREPVKIMDGVRTVEMFTYGAYAIKADNTLWGWGGGSSYALGDGTSTERLSPVKIMDNVASVVASNATYAIKTDGTLWGWGTNKYGFVGDGTATERLSPVKIMDNVTQVSASNSTLAVKSDGTLWAWGNNNEHGRLGDGTTVERRTPVKIMDNVSQIFSIGNGYAIKTDGTLWGWGGASEYSRLGDGAATERLSPVKILDNVAFMAFQSAIKTDGSLWNWGGNETGGVGDGTTTMRLSPVKVMDGVKVPVAVAIEPTPTPTPPATSDIIVTLNGNRLTFDQPPIIENGRTLVPLRAIFEAMGATVEWDQATQTVTGTKGNTVVKMTIGNPVMTVNGQAITLDVPPKVLNGRTLVPARAVAESFDAKVDWDGTTRTVIITTTSAPAVNTGTDTGTAAQANPASDFRYTIVGGEVKITKFLGKGAAVVIPDTIEGRPVTIIGTRAFYMTNSLISVTIPDSVISLEEGAFQSCYSLSSVTIGNGVISIGQVVFDGCGALTSLTIPSSVKSLGRYALYGRNLNSVYFEGDAPTTDGYTFHVNNTSLTVYYNAGTKGWTNPWERQPTEAVGTAPSIGATTPAVSTDDYCQQVFELTNAERAKVGADALNYNSDLSVIAQARAEALAELGRLPSDHVIPGMGDVNQSLNAYKFRCSYAGENCTSSATPAGAIMSWLNSPGHKSNMLGQLKVGSVACTWTDVGIGCAEGANGTYYWVQIFVQ